jgi:hypothetical protein
MLALEAFKALKGLIEANLKGQALKVTIILAALLLRANLKVTIYRRPCGNLYPKYYKKSTGQLFLSYCQAHDNGYSL